MTARARRRPDGRRAPTKAITERVAPSAQERRAHRAESTDAPSRPTDAELDERERRQSAKRKAKGPARSPVTEDDVLIKKAKTTAEPPPTDPR